jgi:radical SAM superfamily enzyme YgiQ (UPF0313 family)
MNVLLIYPRSPQTLYSYDRVLSILGKEVLDPPLSLLTLASVLPTTWSFKLVDSPVGPISEDDWQGCDVVMVSGMGIHWRGMRQAVREARSRGKTVVVGGPGVFYFPDHALAEGADIVVRGEVELAVPRLVEALSNRESGIIIESSSRPDLKDSPSPRYDLVDARRYLSMPLEFSRGCPFNCEFCNTSLILGREIRTKTAQQVLRDLEIIYDIGWRRQVLFVDDNFIGKRRAAKELLTSLIPWMDEHGHPFDFGCSASVNLAEDDELTEMLVRAGFYRVFLGIETPDRESLKLANKHHNARADLDEVCKKINRAGLQIQMGAIIGFDHERPGAGQRIINFAQRNQIPEVGAALLQAGPGTALWKRLEAEGRIEWDGFENTEIGSSHGMMNFVPTRPKEQVLEELVQVYEVLYDPEDYLDRTFSHFAAMEHPTEKGRYTVPYFWELRGTAVTLFRQGVVYPSRFKFWRLLFAAMKKFPDRRFRHFLSALLLIEHYLDYRRTVKEKMREHTIRHSSLDDSVEKTAAQMTIAG